MAFPESAILAVDLSYHFPDGALVAFVVLAAVVVPSGNLGRNPNSKSVPSVVTLYCISLC